MKAVVAAFNQEKALVGTISVIAQLHRLIGYSTGFIPYSIAPIHPRRYHHIIFPLPNVVNILWRHCEWEPVASIHYPKCWHGGPLILQLASILSAAANTQPRLETEEEICGDIRFLIIISSASVWCCEVAREPSLSINMCSICSLYLFSDTFVCCRYAAILFKKQKYVSGQHRYFHTSK